MAVAASPYGTRPNDLASASPQAAPPQSIAMAAPAPDASVPASLSTGSQDISDPAAVPTQVGPAPLNLTQDMKDYGDYLSSHGKDPSEISQYLEYLSAHAPAPQGEIEKQIAQTQSDLSNQKPLTDMSPLEVAGRGADYLGGFARMGLAKGAEAVTGKSIVTEEDMDNVVKGKGPNSDEYLKRLGVSEGITANIPIIGKVTQRGVEGFAADVITDPLTVIGKAVKGLPASLEAAKKVLGLGANEGAEALGKMIYKSGFSKIDAKMVEEGGEPLSKVLLESGAPTGTTAKIQKQVTQIADTMGKMREGLYEKATDLGVTVDLAHPATTKNADEFIAKLAQDKRASVRAQAEELRQYLDNDYKAAGTVDLGTLSQWKTDLYNTLPKSFFAPNGKMSPLGKQFNAILADDFRRSIVEGGNAAQKGLGDSINAINSKWGTLLDARKPLAQQVKQAAGKPIISPVKAAITSVNPIAGAALEAADLASTTAVRTKVGKAALRAGQSGLAGDVARRKLIDSQRGN